MFPKKFTLNLLLMFYSLNMSIVSLTERKVLRYFTGMSNINYGITAINTSKRGLLESFISWVCRGFVPRWALCLTTARMLIIMP